MLEKYGNEKFRVVGNKKNEVLLERIIDGKPVRKWTHTDKIKRKGNEVFFEKLKQITKTTEEESKMNISQNERLTDVLKEIDVVPKKDAPRSKKNRKEVVKAIQPKKFETKSVNEKDEKIKNLLDDLGI